MNIFSKIFGEKRVSVTPYTSESLICIDELTKTKNIEHIHIHCNKNVFYTVGRGMKEYMISGSIEFVRGKQSFKQDFDANSLAQLFDKMRIFCENLNE